MIVPALRATALLVLVTGLGYPGLVTVVAQLSMPAAAEGSLIRDEAGTVVGSRLLGQAFTAPGYLHGRPSAAGAGYDASASGGSNLGPTSQKLADRRAAEHRRLRAENPDAPGDVPEVLLAASGSGLDPHLPPEAARWQLPRIAAARGVDLDRVEALLQEHTEGRDLGFLGEAHVNVLAFNLALDRRFPGPG